MNNLTARSSMLQVYRVTLFLVIACATALFLPERADAQTNTLATCLTGTHTAKWSPGITNTDQTINVATTSKWGACVSPAFPLATMASSEQSFQATFSCQSLRTRTPEITWDIKWSDGATSTYKFTADIYSIGTVNTVIVGVGDIIEGRHKGARALTAFLLGDVKSQLIDQCAKSSGFTEVSGPSMLVIAN